MAHINHLEAEALFRAEADRAKTDPGPSLWIERITRLSELCERAGIRTHIAFLGAALLAKSMDRTVSLKWIKPSHARSEGLGGASGVENAFSIRPLSEKALVPAAAASGVHLGTTGPQPLNNQPYFRMRYLGDDTPMKPGSRAAFDFMLTLIDELNTMDEQQSRLALRAFITVRRRFQPAYSSIVDGIVATRETMSEAVQRFVSENSEGGKRAQACVAALFDAAFSSERVIAGRINDPSRHYPGDVCIVGTSGAVLKAVEVKDKPVTITDIQIFAQKCLDMAVADITYVAVAAGQKPIDLSELTRWSSNFGLQVTIYTDWDELVRQALYWAPEVHTVSATIAIQQVQKRLQAIEASPASVARWVELVRS